MLPFDSRHQVLQGIFHHNEVLCGVVRRGNLDAVDERHEQFPLIAGCIPGPRPSGPAQGGEIVTVLSGAMQFLRQGTDERGERIGALWARRSCSRDRFRRRPYRLRRATMAATCAALSSGEASIWSSACGICREHGRNGRARSDSPCGDSTSARSPTMLPSAAGVKPRALIVVTASSAAGSGLRRRGKAAKHFERCESVCRSTAMLSGRTSRSACADVPPPSTVAVPNSSQSPSEYV